MGLLFLFLFSTLALAAAAQKPQPGLKTPTGKTPFLLQNAGVRNPVLQPDRTIAPGIYHLPQDNMPCVVPDTRTVAAMPNALPVLKIPDLAVIPNPEQTQSRGAFKSFKFPDPK